MLMLVRMDRGDNAPRDRVVGTTGSAYPTDDSLQTRTRTRVNSSIPHAAAPPRSPVGWCLRVAPCGAPHSVTLRGQSWRDFGHCGHQNRRRWRRSTNPGANGRGQLRGSSLYPQWWLAEIVALWLLFHRFGGGNGSGNYQLSTLGSADQRPVARMPHAILPHMLRQYGML